MLATQRTRRLLSLTLVGGMAFTTIAADPAVAINKRERRLYKMTNQERSSRGIRKLVLGDSLSRKARRHSQEMAERGTVVYHSCLSCTLKNNKWTIAGENVGRASRVTRVHQLFMGSKSHRSNILRKGFKKIGVGVVRSSGQVWVTEIFIG